MRWVWEFVKSPPPVPPPPDSLSHGPQSLMAQSSSSFSTSGEDKNTQNREMGGGDNIDPSERERRHPLMDGRIQLSPPPLVYSLYNLVTCVMFLYLSLLGSGVFLFNFVGTGGRGLRGGWLHVRQVKIACVCHVIHNFMFLFLFLFSPIWSKTIRSSEHVGWRQPECKKDIWKK
jgi:hypothetical protein